MYQTLGDSASAEHERRAGPGSSRVRLDVIATNPPVLSGTLVLDQLTKRLEAGDDAVIHSTGPEKDNAA